MTLATAILADSPVHFWEMQEASGSVLTDAVGTPDDGTYVGGFTLAAAGPQTGLPDKGVTFNGSTGFASAPHTTDLNITGDLTLEIWVKPVNFSNYWFFITKATGNGTSATPYEWRMDAGNGRPWFGCASGGGNSNVQATNPLVVGQWNQVAVKRSGTTVTHYLNGVPNGSGTVVAPTGNSLAVLIGSRPDTSWSPTYTAAYAAVFNSALSTAQILAHYTEAGLNAPSDMRLSQLATEVVEMTAPSDMRLSQLATEALEFSTPSDMRVSQIAIEVLWNATASTGYKLAPMIG